MSEPDIQPQEPGAIAGVDQSKLDALAEATVGDIAEALPSLSDLELAQLATIEAAGKNRKSALQAINDELEGREAPQQPVVVVDDGKPSLGDNGNYAHLHARDVEPKLLERPVLTLDGWVLPLPKASAEG